jgi:hypothetical protein
MKSLRKTLINYNWCPYKNRNFGHKNILEGGHHMSMKMAIYKQRREASEEINP